MNAMIGSSSEREIPMVALENLMESGVSLLVLDYTTGNNPVGMIDLECEGYKDSYDLQNTNTAVCLNVGSRGDITSFKEFMFGTARGGFDYTVYTKPAVGASHFESEGFAGSNESTVQIVLNNYVCSALVIIEYFS